MKKIISILVFGLILSNAFSQTKIPNLPLVTGNPVVKDSDLSIINKHDSVGSSATVSRQTCITYFKNIKAYCNTGTAFADTNFVGVQFIKNSLKGDTLKSNGRETLIDSSAKLAALIIMFPKNPLTGQVFNISLSDTVTTLTLLGGYGGTPKVEGTISTVTTNTSGAWIYYAPSKTWYKRE